MVVLVVYSKTHGDILMIRYSFNEDKHKKEEHNFPVTNHKCIYNSTSINILKQDVGHFLVNSGIDNHLPKIQFQLTRLRAK